MKSVKDVMKPLTLFIILVLLVLAEVVAFKWTHEYQVENSLKNTTIVRKVLNNSCHHIYNGVPSLNYIVDCYEV